MSKHDQAMQLRLELFAQAKKLGITNIRPTMPNHKIEQMIEQAKEHVLVEQLRKECHLKQVAFNMEDSAKELEKKIEKAITQRIKQEQAAKEAAAKKEILAEAKLIGLELAKSLDSREMKELLEARKSYLKDQIIKQPLIDEAASIGLKLDVILTVSEMKKAIKGQYKHLRVQEAIKQKEKAAHEARIRKENEEKARQEAAREAAKAAALKAKQEAKAEAQRQKELEAKRAFEKQLAEEKARQEELARIEAERLAKAEAIAFARRQKQEAARFERESKKKLIEAMKQHGISFNTDSMTSMQIEEKINDILEKRLEKQRNEEAKRIQLERARHEKAQRIAAEQEAARIAAEQEARRQEKERQAALAAQRKAQILEEKQRRALEAKEAAAIKKAERLAVRNAIKDVNRKLIEAKIESRAEALISLKDMKAEIAKQKAEQAELHKQLVAEKKIKKESLRVEKLEAKELAKAEKIRQMEEVAKRKQEEIKRLEKEKAKIMAAEQKAKEKHMQQLAAEKAEQERLAAIKAEEERVAKELAQKEAEQKAKQEAKLAALEKARAERAAKLAAEKQAKLLAEQKAEQEKQAMLEAKRIAKEKELAQAKEQEAKIRKDAYEMILTSHSFEHLNEIAFDMQKDLANVQDEINAMIDKVKKVDVDGHINDFECQPETYEFYDMIVEFETRWAEHEQVIARKLLIESDELGKVSFEELNDQVMSTSKEVNDLANATGTKINKKIKIMSDYLVKAHEYVAYLNDVYEKDIKKQEKARKELALKQAYERDFARAMKKSIDPEFKAPKHGTKIETLIEMISKSNEEFQTALILNTVTKQQIKEAKKLGIKDFKGLTRPELEQLIKDTKVEIAKQETKEQKARKLAEQKEAKRIEKEKLEAEKARIAKEEAEHKARIKKEEAELKAKLEREQAEEAERIAKFEAESKKAQEEEKARQLAIKKEAQLKDKQEYDEAIAYARSIGLEVKKGIGKNALADAVIAYEKELREKFYAAMEEEKNTLHALEQARIKVNTLNAEFESAMKQISDEHVREIQDAHTEYTRIEKHQFSRIDVMKQKEEKALAQLQKSLSKAKGGFANYPYTDKINIDEVIYEDEVSVVSDTTIEPILMKVKEQVVDKVEDAVEKSVQKVVKVSKEMPKILTMKIDTKHLFKKTKNSNRWNKNGSNGN